MSGGSFDYLYAMDDAEMIVNWGYLRSLIEMTDAARVEGYEISEDMSKWYDKIKEMKEELEKGHEKFRDFMKAFEWWKSGDSGKDSVDKAFEKWKVKK